MESNWNTIGNHLEEIGKQFKSKLESNYKQFGKLREGYWKAIGKQLSIGKFEKRLGNYQKTNGK